MKVIDLLNKFDKIKTRNFFLIAGVSFLLLIAISRLLFIISHIIALKRRTL